MADIMMCDALHCEKSKQCYRHKDSGTQANQYLQTYWLRDEQSPVGDDCDQFWKVTPLVKEAHDGTF